MNDQERVIFEVKVEDTSGSSPQATEGATNVPPNLTYDPVSGRFKDSRTNRFVNPQTMPEEGDPAGLHKLGMGVPGTPKSSLPKDQQQAQDTRNRAAADYWTGQEVDPFTDGPFGPEVDKTQPDPESDDDMTRLLADMRHNLGRESAERATKEAARSMGQSATKMTGSSLIGQGVEYGAGMLGSEAAIAAAGPLAIAAVVAVVASMMNNKAAAAMMQGGQAAGQGLAGPRGSIDIGSGVQTLIKQTDQNEERFGLNLTLVDDALESMLVTVREVTKGLADMGEGMGMYSPDVATALAEREVRRIETELFRADELGEPMGRFIDANSRIEESLEQIKIVLLSDLLPPIASALETLAAILPALRLAAGVTGDVIASKLEFSMSKSFLNVLASYAPPGPTRELLKNIATLIGPLGRMLNKEEDKKNPNMLAAVQDFLNPARLPEHLPGGFFPAPPGGGAGAGGP